MASFFVSRVDGKVDAKLDEIGREDLKGKAAIANARIAYESFQRIFSGERWERLAAAGANVQRPLWASTSTKNPDYPDTLYVDELIGPDTVNTMPDATIEAARDHATVARTVDKDVPGAHKLMDELREAGVDVDDIVKRQLVEEGVASFAKSFDSLIRGEQGRDRLLEEREDLLALLLGAQEPTRHRLGLADRGEPFVAVRAHVQLVAALAAALGRVHRASARRRACPRCGPRRRPGATPMLAPASGWLVQHRALGRAASGRRRVPTSVGRVVLEQHRELVAAQAGHQCRRRPQPRSRSPIARSSGRRRRGRACR